jgi:Mg2+-importing ATPase
VLLGSTIAVIVLAFTIPYLPLTDVFGFVPIPGTLLGTIVLITVAYVVATELQKRWFYRSVT